MKYIRSIFAVFCFFIFGIGAVILNFLLFPFIKNNKELCSDIIHNTWRFFVNLMMFLKLFRLDVKKLKKIENKVIVSTHPSFIDIVILIALIPRSTCFVKKELADGSLIEIPLGFPIHKREVGFAYKKSVKPSKSLELFVDFYKSHEPLHS